MMEVMILPLMMKHRRGKKFEYSGGSKTAFIADVLGLSRDEVNYQMGPQAGWTYKDGE